MADLPTLTDEDFNDTVQNTEAPVLVDFSATWCQPCKMLAPTIEAVAKEYEGRLTVFNVDVEEAQETAINLGVTGVPTCILFRDGKEVDRFSGNQDINSVRERIEKVIAL